MTPHHILKSLKSCDDMFTFVDDDGDDAVFRDTVRNIFPLGHCCSEFITNDAEDLIRIIEEIIGEGAVDRHAMSYALDVTEYNHLNANPVYSWAQVILTAEQAVIVRMIFELEP